MAAPPGSGDGGVSARLSTTHQVSGSCAGRRASPNEPVACAPAATSQASSCRPTLRSTAMPARATAACARPAGHGRRASAGPHRCWWCLVTALALGKGATTLRAASRPGPRRRREHVGVVRAISGRGRAGPIASSAAAFGLLAEAGAAVMTLGLVAMTPPALAPRLPRGSSRRPRRAASGREGARRTGVRHLRRPAR